MTCGKAKTKPLNELLGYLTCFSISKCGCKCKEETWLNKKTNDADYNMRTCKSIKNYGKCPERIAYERVMAACEKATKKKPKGDYHSVPHFRCPNCTNTVKMFCDDPEIPYCKFCGQALDWSNEREEEE